ncbi:beta-ketoacyl-ACP synthase [Pseudoduganella plicata]|uniref:Beta-ketoacyl-ACP synthase n=1 Tax=Pseudoduganella plicata TaxID=321984 RepID=A0A4P7BJ98_9BURK|nr:beta-ketoacyl-ACP synthase [Pseudoduganella plicata]QBQ38403.1 beta-ketoacyl-ACP synthase [Pseudoduganella plicata]GGY81817.1 beta-ketoacyl-[acyl-carrier-protein] synthase II [Pseudoduganella plicata]
MRHCYIHGMGVVSAAGVGRDALYASLLNGNQDGFVASAPLWSGRRATIGVVGQVLAPLPARLAHFASRTNILLHAALEQAADTIHEAVERYGADRVGVVMGSCTAGFQEADRARAAEAQGALPPGYRHDIELMDSVSAMAAAYAGATGPTLTVSTACTSSGKAIAMGLRLIRSGQLDAVIVGGADSHSLSTLNGFDCLASIADGMCQPLGQARNGINLGEGAAVLVLRADPAPLRLMGAGESSDGHHISAPDPQGRGAELAIRRALASAAVAPADVGYLNLHGTATVQNDEVEAAAVYRVFGDGVVCSSTKNLTGHTLGAASALELVACATMLERGNGAVPVIPQHGDYPRDPALAPIALGQPGQHSERTVFASTSFAFGGSNVCLVIGRSAHDHA